MHIIVSCQFAVGINEGCFEIPIDKPMATEKSSNAALSEQSKYKLWNIGINYLLKNLSVVRKKRTVSCPISGHFLQNCNILPQNSTNELKFSHNVVSTAGK